MKSVTIYSTPTCPYCTMAKAYLTEKGVTFSDVDVSSDRVKQDEMVEKSGQMGVPVTVIADEQDHEEVTVGFDKRRLAQLLDLPA